MSIEEENVILESPDMDKEPKLFSLVEDVRRFTVSVVPKQFVIETDSCSIKSYVVQVEGLRILSKEIVGKFSVVSPILDSSVVEGVQVDRADLFCLVDSIDIVLSEQIQDIFTDFSVVEVPIHL